MPDASDPRVQREIERVRDGKRLRPVLAAGDVIADGEHRLVAANHLDPTAAIAVIRTARSNEKRKGTPVSKQKIQKSIQSSAARAAIASCADELDRYASEPGVAGLVSKLRASIEAPGVPDDGTTLATGMLDGAVTSQYRTSAEKVEKALGRMTELRKRDDISPEAREAVRKASRDLQMEYLHAVSPSAARSVEEYRAADARRQVMSAGGIGPAVLGDDAQIKKAAEKLQKADPTLSAYDALESAYRAARAA